MTIGPRRFDTEYPTQDGDWRPAITVLKRDGITPRDVSGGDVDVECEIRHVDEATVYTRKKSVPGETVWPTDEEGVDGNVEFVFLAAFLAARTPGTYLVDYWEVEAGSSVRRKLAYQRVVLGVART